MVLPLQNPDGMPAKRGDRTDRPPRDSSSGTRSPVVAGSAADQDEVGGRRVEVEGYTDLVEIGRGAFATVYRACQVSLDREIALKVLAVTTVDDDARRRFDRECKAIGNLGWHPRVLPVYDAGITASGNPYLAMELLSGGSLAQALHRDGPMVEREALTFAIEIADALEAAHQAGVVHRDVKPGNVLIDRFGEPKLSDFGVAVIGGSATSTGDGLSGTLGFLAPELLDGGAATPSSDVYALGATLHLMVTGTAAFKSKTGESPMALLARIQHEPVSDPGALGVSDAVARLVVRALAKQAADRPPTAQAFIREAERVLVAHGWDLVATYAPRDDQPDGPEQSPTRSEPVPPAPPETPSGKSPGRAADLARDSLPPVSIQPPPVTHRSVVKKETPPGPTTPAEATATTSTGPGFRSTLGGPRRDPTSVSRETTGAVPITSAAVPPATARVPVATVSRSGQVPTPAATPSRTPAAADGPAIPPASPPIAAASPTPAPEEPDSAPRRGRKRAAAIAVLILVVLVVVVAVAASRSQDSTAVDVCTEGSLLADSVSLSNGSDGTVLAELTMQNTCEVTQIAKGASATVTLSSPDTELVTATFDLSSDPLVVGGHESGTMTLEFPSSPALADAIDNASIKWDYTMPVRDDPNGTPSDSGPIPAS